MNTLNVPTVGISELKRSPADIFRRADSENNAVYIFNRSTVVGVVMTREQYESMNARIDRLENIGLNDTVSQRLNGKSKILPDSKVRSKTSRTVSFDDSDGWI